MLDRTSDGIQTISDHSQLFVAENLKNLNRHLLDLSSLRVSLSSYNAQTVQIHGSFFQICGGTQGLSSHNRTNQGTEGKPSTTSIKLDLERTLTLIRNEGEFRK
jgi:hypothetical protein